MTEQQPTPAPPSHLYEAAVHLRSFNHTSQNLGEGWQHPADSYTAISALGHIVRMLPQAIEQSLRPALATGTPTQQTAALKDWQHAARQLARQLVIALDETHSALSPMGASLPKDDNPGATS